MDNHPLLLLLIMPTCVCVWAWRRCNTLGANGMEAAWRTKGVQGDFINIKSVTRSVCMCRCGRRRSTCCSFCTVVNNFCAPRLPFVATRAGVWCRHFCALTATTAQIKINKVRNDKDTNKAVELQRKAGRLPPLGSSRSAASPCDVHGNISLLSSVFFFISFQPAL